MTKIIPLFFSVLLLAFSASAEAEEILVDRIVAVVNNEVITQFELDNQIKTISGELQKRGTPLPEPSVLKKQILEKMIMDRLQAQFAKENGLRIDDEQLDKTLQRIAQENKLSMEEFHQAVERDGTSFAKFREEIRSEILRSRLKEREVDSKILVTDTEADNYLKTQQAQGKEEYHLAHILVRVPEEADASQIKEKKAKILEAFSQLKKGADFGQVSAAFSDAPDALQGGDIGWRPKARLPGLFVAAIDKMEKGQISPIMQSPNGFHIVKLIDKRDADSSTLVTQTHVRHILAKTGEMVSEDEAKNKLKEILSRIQRGADFAEEAKLHSDDSSASNGGDIGWVSPGDTVPDFEKAMNELKEGQVSGLVHSPFGWHLIQVIGRRTEDLSREKQKSEAKQALAARKSDEAYQDWLRQLRDKAYVEYHLDEK